MEVKRNTEPRFRAAEGRLLQQSVLKHIPRHRDGVLEGAAIGFDAAIFQNGGMLELQAIGAEPTSRFPEDYPLTAGEAAWITAENQLAVKGVFAAGTEPADVRITAESRSVTRGVSVAAQILLVAGMSCPESIIRREMQRLTQFAATRGCPIVGGNTVHFQEGEDCLVQVILTGHMPNPHGTKCTQEGGQNVPDCERNGQEGGQKESTGQEHDGAFRKPAAGDRVYFLGEVGCLGADLLVKAKRDRLRDRFAESYIKTMEYDAEDFYVGPLARAAQEAGACFLHDVSNGGVHAALYQLAEAAGCGIRVRHEGLTIRQSVIELCEELSINPYLLLGTGGLLAAVPEERAEAFEMYMAKYRMDADYGTDPQQVDTDPMTKSYGDAERETDDLTGFARMESSARRFSCRPAGQLTKEKARVVYAENFHMERYLNLPDGDALDEALLT